MYRNSLSSITLVAVAMAAAPAPALANDWTGFYGGLQLGFFSNVDETNFDTDIDGQFIGMFGGYRYDFGSIVAGVELDLMTGSGESDTAFGVVDIDYEQLNRLGVELGYDAGPALLYATAGYASLKTYVDFFDVSDTVDGVFYGIGMDYRVGSNWTVGAELLAHDFPDWNEADNDLSATTFGINAAFTF